MTPTSNRRLTVHDVNKLRQAAGEIRSMTTKLYDTDDVIQSGRQRGLEAHRVLAEWIENIADELEARMVL
jgi:hypothetical protein